MNTYKGGWIKCKSATNIQHSTPINQHHHSSTPNIQHPSPNITIHQHLTFNTYHPTSDITIHQHLTLNTYHPSPNIVFINTQHLTPITHHAVTISFVKILSNCSAERRSWNSPRRATLIRPVSSDTMIAKASES